MNLRNIFTYSLTCALMLSLCACSIKGGKSTKDVSEPQDLIVFAASSMTETLTDLGNIYMSENPDINLVFNFDSSGTLKTQIEEGADVDIFISAGEKQMSQLDKAASNDDNTDNLDFIIKGTRIDLLENKIVLAVPSGNPAGIQSFDDMIAGLKNGSIMLAIGNSDVPVGQYTQMILDYYGVNENALVSTDSITYCSNVKEVTTQVSEGTVDCGIIYQTDALSAGLSVVDTATKKMCGQVIYPAAVMNVSKKPEAAKAFLEYLTSDAADNVFEKAGFTPVK